MAISKYLVEALFYFRTNFPQLRKEMQILEIDKTQSEVTFQKILFF